MQSPATLATWSLLGPLASLASLVHYSESPSQDLSPAGSEVRRLTSRARACTILPPKLWKKLRNEWRTGGNVSCTPELTAEEPVPACWGEGRRRAPSPSRASGRTGDTERSFCGRGLGSGGGVYKPVTRSHIRDPSQPRFGLESEAGEKLLNSLVHWRKATRLFGERMSPDTLEMARV